MTISTLRALPGRAALRPLWTRLREFHAYHGPWALGVRALRHWRLQTKILAILMILALPIGPLAMHAFRDLQLKVDSSMRYAAVIDAVDRVHLLQRSLRDLQLGAAVGGASDADAAPRRWQALGEALASLAAAGFPEAGSWRDGREVVERAVGETGLTPAARRQAAERAQAALTELRRDLIDASGIASAGDEALARVAELALELLPDVTQTLAALHGALGAQAAPADAGGEDAHPLLMRAAGEVHALRRVVATVQSRLPRLPLAGDEGVPVREIAVRMGSVTERIAAAALAREPAAARAELPALERALRRDAVQLRERLTAEARLLVERQLAQAQRQRLQVYALLGVCTLVAGYLLYTFFLVMRGGLDTLGQQVQRMALGDLSARPAPLGGDEVAEMLAAMTTSLARLSDLLAQVRTGIGAVTQAAYQVASGNADLSARNRSTAQGLDDVVASVLRYSEQLEACGREVEGVVSTVQALRLEAARNRKQMDRLQERLAALRSQSRDIGDIVRLIDGIAFRTNILALNASIEASKAGDAGRGFSVVAQEVRSLALRSAESARRIDAIVTRSTDDIEASGDLADETARALARLDAHVDRIHGAMNGVATLTRSGETESAAILQQVKVLQDGSTQNQQLVEQLAQASDAMRSQGQSLEQSIAQFRLG